MQIGDVDQNNNCPVCGSGRGVLQSTNGRSQRFSCNKCDYNFSNAIRQASLRLSSRDADMKKPKKNRNEYDQQQIEKGIKIEMEHTTNENIAANIAMNHLDENPHYYNYLIPAEKQWEKEEKKTARILRKFKHSFAIGKTDEEILKNVRKTLDFINKLINDYGTKKFSEKTYDSIMETLYHSELNCENILAKKDADRKDKVTANYLIPEIKITRRKVENHQQQTEQVPVPAEIVPETGFNKKFHIDFRKKITARVKK